MVLPSTALLCDAVEFAAITHPQQLGMQDLCRQFFPAQKPSEVEADIRDALGLAAQRNIACGGGYPFVISPRSIEFKDPNAFNVYIFLLLGRGLEFGGPKNEAKLLRQFRKLFEDVVCWTMRKAGFLSEVLSIPRSERGLHTKLAPALGQIADRFREPAKLIPSRLMPHDNDLDVDVLSIATRGNGIRGGWPVFQIQCATGPIMSLEAKISEGCKTFGTVWDHGFYAGCLLRAAATPDDLISLQDTYWLRLCQAGWILDRTRIAYLANGNAVVPLPSAIQRFWPELWASRAEICWQTGWQGA